MIELILTLLLATCPACNHIDPSHSYTHEQMTTMSDGDSDEGGGETGHIPNQPPPPPTRP